MHTRTLRTPALALAALGLTTAASYGQSAVATGNVPIDGIGIVEFTLGPGGTFLDLTSNGSLDVATAGGADTEIALYSGFGPGATYVASADALSGGDDDDGIGVASTLSYGTGSGLLLGDSFNLGGDGLANGEDGAYPGAGDYTLVIGEFSTIFTDGPTLGDINDFGDEEVVFLAEIYSDASVTVIPEPAALSVAGLAGLALLRRRRNA